MSNREADSTLAVKIEDRIVVHVSTSRDKMSTWILLEQEDWFEDEIKFLRKICRNDWHVLDIGANHGVYSLALAGRGAKHIWAFEPTAEPMGRFRQSIAANKFDTVIDALPMGLSDSTGPATMALAGQSELNSLHADSTTVVGTETIQLDTLDGLMGGTIPTSTQVDFVKLDAEGEEIAILRGGVRFFSEQSPLVMFERKHGHVVNSALIGEFRQRGYQIFRLIPGLACLVTVPPGREQQLDGFVLNLFACKEDRRASLVQQGAILPRRTDIEGEITLEPAWLDSILSHPAYRQYPLQAWRETSLESPYGTAVAAWCGSRQAGLALEDRFVLLNLAKQHLEHARDAKDSHPAVVYLAIRVFSDLGLRAEAVKLAKIFIAHVPPDGMLLDRPVPPASPRFDQRSARVGLPEFLHQAALEALIVSQAFSSYFTSAELLREAVASREHSAQMARRATLCAWRANVEMPPGSDAQLFADTTDNLNSGLWRQLLQQRQPGTSL
jgi:FkbM family methyltransferase